MSEALLLSVIQELEGILSTETDDEVETYEDSVIQVQEGILSMETDDEVETYEDSVIQELEGILSTETDDEVETYEDSVIQELEGILSMETDDEVETDKDEIDEDETDEDEDEADEDEYEDETYEDEDETDEDVETEEEMERKTNKAKEQMKRVIKEMREIVDIVRVKKLEEGKTLNFMVSDLVEVADLALHLFKPNDGHSWPYNSIHSRIGEIKKRMLKLGDDGAETESNINMISSENVVDDDVDVVGLEEDVKMLLRRSILDGYHLKTVLIKGMSGIGKTTLAREIYNHASVVQRFKTRAWVSNSTSFSTVKELLIKVIQQVEDPQNLHTSSLLENMDNRGLLDTLRQHLQEERYLIVLDNVPKHMYLSSFLEALPNEPKNGSRLLLTSHTAHVDLGFFDVHKMEYLDSNKSWQLFLKTINHGNKLTGEHKFPMNLKQMGKQMLKKCGGLPLGIKEVGKQLAEKKLSGGSEWEQLLESVDFGPILKLLEPFIHQLDPKVQSCFLCMAFFKENITLRNKKVMPILDAAGGMDSEYGIESSYFYRLIDESVIDVKEKTTEYHMNPLLHMLSIQKAEEEIGFEVLRNNGNNRPFESPRHHRVIICSRDKFKYSTDQDKHLVSLFFHGGGYFDASLSYWKSFELLKILDLEDFGLKILPETIGALMELRYLGLRNNYIKELPQSLRCLKKLEVLDIALNFMVEVPDIIWKMDSLLHIYMSDVVFWKPLKIHTLQNLKTLTYVSVDNLTYELSGLKLLTHLEKLGIQGLDGNSDVSKIFVSLAGLENLRHLILRGYRFRSMPCLDEIGILQNLKTLKLDGLLTMLPNNLPQNIRSLALIDSCLDKDPMPLLATTLPFLKYLKLRNAYTGKQIVILHDSFGCLTLLCIEELWNLRNVQCGKDAMCYLEKLEIHDCPYLDTLPDSNRAVRWKEVKIVTTKSVAAKIRKSNYVCRPEVMKINP